MGTNYYVEYIERITEQMIEQEILDMIDKMVSDVSNVRDNAINLIIADKRELLQKFSEAFYEENGEIKEGIRKRLNDICQNAINESEVVENRIEELIRNIIVENGYKIEIKNDGIGNVAIELKNAKEAI